MVNGAMAGNDFQGMIEDTVVKAIEVVTGVDINGDDVIGFGTAANNALNYGFQRRLQQPIFEGQQNLYGRPDADYTDIFVGGAGDYGLGGYGQNNMGFGSRANMPYGLPGAGSDYLSTYSSPNSFAGTMSGMNMFSADTGLAGAGSDIYNMGHSHAGMYGMDHGAMGHGDPGSGHGYIHHQIVGGYAADYMLPGETPGMSFFDPVRGRAAFESGITGSPITLRAAFDEALEEDPNLTGRDLENKAAQILTGYNSPDNLPQSAQDELDAQLVSDPRFGAPYDDLSDDQQLLVRHLFLHSMVENPPIDVRGTPIGELELEAVNGTIHTRPDPGQNIEDVAENFPVEFLGNGYVNVSILSEQDPNNAHNLHNIQKFENIYVGDMSEREIQQVIYDLSSKLDDNNDNYPLSSAAVVNGRAMGYPV